MKIYFGNRAGKHLVGSTNDLKECSKIMNDYIKEKNLPSAPYRRYFENDGLIQVDFGSYSHFFYIGDISVAEFLQLGKE